MDEVTDIRERLRQLTEAQRRTSAPGKWEAESHYQLEKGCRCLSCWEPVEGSWDIRTLAGLSCHIHPECDEIVLSEGDVAALTAVLDLADELVRESGAGTDRVRVNISDRIRAVVAAAGDQP
jgi:hypothetical protein